MIYIDPPYNTGNDFIYEDDFAEDSESYLQRSNQKDEVGNRLIANNESNGRFHSDWLSMVYPRLKLAFNLLNDDGFILVSIDDAEYSNIKKLMDEVYGENNYISTVVWDKNRKNDAKFFSVGHEYMLVYSKNKQFLIDNGIILREKKEGLDVAQEFYKKLKLKYGHDNEAVQKEWRAYFNSLAKDSPMKVLGRFSKIDNQGPYRDDGNISWPGGNGPKYEVIHPITKKPCKVPDGGWRYSTAKRFWEEVESGRVVFGDDETTLPRQARYLFESEGQVMTSVHFSYAQTATMNFIDLMGNRLFDNPKSWHDIKRLVNYLTNRDSIVVDFFSGSATTAHSVIELNAEDGGKRRFIMVQLPEICDEKSEAFKAGYLTIAEIGKERIRRAGQKIIAAKAAPTKAAPIEAAPATGANLDVGAALAATEFNDEMGSTNIADKIAAKAAPTALDIGFRVLKIDSSNMNEIYYTPDALKQGDLFNFVDNVRDDRTEEDLLFQVLLDWGVDLSLPITRETIAGNSVLFVDGNALAACFDKDGGITEDFVKQLAACHPLRVVFRDAGFANDSVKINIEQIFKLLSPGTEIKTL
ncbi:MAG: site-specific DNA-methyltransferase [Methylobacter sp.]